MFLYGRRMYQLMEGFWPKAEEDTSMSKENLEIARLINNTDKIVFSKTLKKVSESKNWKNVRLVRDFDSKEITRLKKQPGKGIWVGGSDLAVSFAKAGLIDEFRLMVNPVFVGAGRTLLDGYENRLKLRLIGTRSFKSGNVLLTYVPQK